MSFAQRIPEWPPMARRALATVMLLLLISTAAVVVVMPVVWLVSGDAWREEAQRRLAEDRAWADAAAHVQERIAELASNPGWQQFYPAKEPDEATAMLLTDLRGALGRGGVNATSAIPLKSEATGPLPEVGARVVAMMVATQLRQVLQEISGHSRHLEIRRLSVTAPPAQTPNENPVLMVTLEVAGLLDPRAKVAP